MHYHAGRTGLARDRVQRAFELGRVRVLVATSAFGMGVDYPDVRAIVHFQAPGSLQAYYPEAGRASRDGNPGRCVMLFGVADRRRCALTRTRSPSSSRRARPANSATARAPRVMTEFGLRFQMFTRNCLRLWQLPR
jgi:ATP-dependent DNA helicase RecQ